MRNIPLLFGALAALLGLGACQQKHHPHAAASASTTAPPPTPPPRTTKIERRIPEAGSSRHDTITRWFAFAPLEPSGKRLTIEETMERDVKILSSSEEAVTKIEVQYGEVKRSITQGSDKKTETDPRSGNRYEVKLELGQLSATEGGKPVAEDVAATMEADHVALGLPLPLPSLLPDEPLRPGDDFDLSHDVVLAIFPVDVDGDFDVTGMKLTFQRAGNQQAFFAMQTRFWGTHDGRRIEFDGKGTLIATLPAAWPVHLKVEGKAKLLANATDNPAGTRTGEGRIELKTTYK